MRALRYATVGGPLELVDLPAPDCPEDGVVLDVVATGVCRSDWHAWRGADPVALPHVPGHEFAGTVAVVGAGVRKWRRGDRVTAPFVLGCGACEYCRAGDAQICPRQEQPGFTLPGSFAEQLALPRADVNLVAVPGTVDPVAAASLGCRFATAFRALTVHGRVRPGQWVAVHGCGGVGLSAVMIAVAAGARVVAIDLSAAARQRATELGAEAVVAPAPVAGKAQDVVTQVVELTGGGAHIGIDAIGSPDVVLTSISSLRRRGRHLQLGLLLGREARASVPMDLVISRELEIFGSHGMAAHEYPALLAAVADGRLQPERLVGRVVDLAAATGVLAALDQQSGPGMTVVRVQPWWTAAPGDPVRDAEPKLI